MIIDEDRLIRTITGAYYMHIMRNISGIDLENLEKKGG